MTIYEEAQARIRDRPRIWSVTGVAGFIGCNLLKTLLESGQQVIGLDNFETGNRDNLKQIEAAVGSDLWARFKFIEGDICNLEDCRESVAGVDYVLHHAALGSIPRSVENPIRSSQANIDGSLNMLVASRDVGARFVYAASSSTYGDSARLPKVEDEIGRPLSPYAVTKYVNELYADVFARTYGMKTVGLRYFNVFGPYQSPDGAYAAVIPRWVDAMISGGTVTINGDGETSRDFCYVANVVQANILAATTKNKDALNQVYNIAVGERTSLNELIRLIQAELLMIRPNIAFPPPVHKDFRVGDVRHSLADIGKVQALLGYEPSHTVARGMKEAVGWYVNGRRSAS